MIYDSILFFAYYRICFTIIHAFLNYLRYKNKSERLVFTRNVLAFCVCFTLTKYGIQCHFFDNDVTMLSVVMITYIINDCLNMIIYSIFQSYEAWLHHVITICMVWYSSTNEHYDFVLIHLSGVGELPTIFLCVCDTFKHIPSLQRSYPKTNLYVRVLFVVSFIVVRVLWWSCVILYFPPTEYVVVNACTYGLLVMQYYWASKLVKRTMTMKLN